MKFNAISTRLALSALALAMLNVNSAYAGEGSESSGGGNSIVCFSDKAIAREILNKDNPDFGEILNSHLDFITSIEAIDLYQARQPRGFQEQNPEIIPIGQEETPFQYVEKIVTRLKHSVPKLASIIKESKDLFVDDNIILEPNGLRSINDANQVQAINSESCVAVTVAAQYKAGPSSFYLHIDDRLFNHPAHSNLSKAVLLLHEYVYRYARSLGQFDSRNTRLLVSYLITQNNGLTSLKLAKKALDLGFISGDPAAFTYVVDFKNRTVKSLVSEFSIAILLNRLNNLDERDAVIELSIKMTRLLRKEYGYMEFCKVDAFSIEEMGIMERERTDEDCGRVARQFIKDHPEHPANNKLERMVRMADAEMDKLYDLGIAKVNEAYASRIRPAIFNDQYLPESAKQKLNDQIKTFISLIGKDGLKEVLLRRYTVEMFNDMGRPERKQKTKLDYEIQHNHELEYDILVPVIE